MSGMVYAAPPAQITLSVSFSEDTQPPVERVFRWLDLEGRLSLDPNKVLLPTRGPTNDQADPQLEDLHLFRMEWTDLLDEDSITVIYVIESLFPDIAKHCALCFPVNIVQCKGSGRVQLATVILKPISGAAVLYSLHRLHDRLHEASREVQRLNRQVEMLLENQKALTQNLLRTTPELMAYLHRDTPSTWFESLTEEY